MVGVVTDLFFPFVCWLAMDNIFTNVIHRFFTPQTHRSDNLTIPTPWSNVNFMKTQISAVQTATQKITPSGVNNTPRPTPKLMPMVKPLIPKVSPVVANTTRPVPRIGTPLAMPQRKTQASFTPPQYGKDSTTGDSSTKRVTRFKRGEVDDLAYLQDDMEFLTKLSRGDNNSQLVRLERSSHFRERQVERSIRTSEIFDIINNPKMFSYQKERVWKVEGQNGISILIAFSGLTTTGKQILLGITVYAEESPSTLSYKQWSQNLSNAKKLTKKTKKHHQESSR